MTPITSDMTTAIAVAASYPNHLIENKHGQLIGQCMGVANRSGGEAKLGKLKLEQPREYKHLREISHIVQQMLKDLPDTRHREAAIGLLCDQVKLWFDGDYKDTHRTRFVPQKIHDAAASPDPDGTLGRTATPSEVRWINEIRARDFIRNVYSSEGKVAPSRMKF